METGLQMSGEGPQVNIHPNRLQTTLKKVANWKTPGLDGIHGFYFKNFASIYDILATEIKRFSYRNRGNRINDQREDYSDLKKSLQRNHPNNYWPSQPMKMEEKNQKEYLKRTRKLIETKLYSRNLVKRINTFAVLLVRYSERFLKWTREELKQIDQRTRKLMTMQKALYPRDDVDRLYVSRREGRRGLASIEDSLDVSI